MTTNTHPKAGKVSIPKGTRPATLKEHQIKAIKAISDRINGQSKFAGLLVMPTGSGKTVTAVSWLLQNVINHRKKLLWIAHRHELLNQALQTFINNACSEILPNRQDFQYRIISGLAEHDQPVHITASDDLIIAGKDSLQKGGLDYLLRQWARGQDEIFLVIDEAHHATAKTYRFIIDGLARKVPHLKVLGLTATPTRTLEQEQGLLKKVFPDDIVYKIDLKTLIARGILAQPVFRDTQTHYEIAGEISESDLKRIKQFDLPTDIATKMATHKERNHLIVSEYFERLSENGGYGQTLVFALNIEHAITLDALFNEQGKTRGIKSAFVVSDLRDAYIGVNVSKEQNQQHIADFRKGNIQVLINVLILTEGVDLPQAETVFLTRPTISEILMTQMIGRVLRGPEMGGTRQAQIVTFVDDWQNKVSWVSPELLTDREADFPEDSYEAVQGVIHLVSVAKMQEFARLLDQSIDTGRLEKLPAIERVPLGLYSFILQNEKRCVVLVYSHHKPIYDAILWDLPDLFQEADLDGNLTLEEAEVAKILPLIKQRYFENCESLLAPQDEDLVDILKYFGEKGANPPYLEFKDREKYDISKLAREILDKKMDRQAEGAYLARLWDDTTTFWKTYYGNNKKYFLNEVQLEINKFLHPDLYPTQPTQVTPVPTPASSPVSRQEVLKRDNHHCLCCGADWKPQLQLDHIKARAHGGDDSLTNLQTLCLTCNGSKGDTTLNFLKQSTPLHTPLSDFRKLPLPSIGQVSDNKAWERHLRRSINFFYQCAAVKKVTLQSDKWQITLHPGNDPTWFKPYLHDSLKLIQNRHREVWLTAPITLEITSNGNGDNYES